MKILLIEDEIKLSAYLCKGLGEAGYNVDAVYNGVDGLHIAVEGSHDAVILDAMLPGIDGFSVLAALRKIKQTPVLMLTARVSVEDRVHGLQTGADDYLVKPFAFAELLARVRTLLRRGSQAVAPDRVQVGDLILDLSRRRASRAGKRITLTSKEFALLELLVRRRGEVLPRSLIASQVWDMNFDSDTNVIDVAVRRLRAKIDDHFETKLIQTVRGMGYLIDEPELDTPA